MGMTKITDVKARRILDSRGLPTIEVDVYTDGGSYGRASVPSGKSTGGNEAVEKRDHDPHHFFGYGVDTAIRAVEDEIAPRIKGLDAQDQEGMDARLNELDGTPDKSRLGANAIVGVSLATARAAATAQHVSLVKHLSNLYGATPDVLPIPMMNVVNGGKHADSGLSVQEFMIVPHGAKNMPAAIRMGAEIYYAIRKLLEEQGHRVSVGDEGGFAPKLATANEVLQVLTEAVQRAGYEPGTDVSFALDFAANDFFKDGLYHYEGNRWTSGDLTDYCVQLAASFPIVSFEDPLAEDDWDGWEQLTKRLNSIGLQCVGDDIFVTNETIVREGISRGIANAVLIKPNQIGTLSETFKTMKLAQEAGYRMVISHRSGETDDPFIADLAAATNAGQIKAGAPARGERVAKYNQLLRLSNQLPNALLPRGIYQLARGN